MLSSASVTTAQSTWGDVMGSEKQVRALDRIRKIWTPAWGVRFVLISHSLAEGFEPLFKMLYWIGTIPWPSVCRIKLLFFYWVHCLPGPLIPVALYSSRCLFQVLRLWDLSGFGGVIFFRKDLIFFFWPYTVQAIDIDVLDLGQLCLFSQGRKIRYSVFLSFMFSS